MGSPSQRGPLQTDQRHKLFSAALIGAVFVICLIRLIGFVEESAVNLLFDDQWDYLTPLFDGRGPWVSFFYQHGPPRMGLGNLIDWYLYAATGWDVRAVAWAAVTVLALTTAAALALVVRLRGHPRWSDIGFPLVLLSPIHWESMTLTPSLAPMILPLLFTFLLAHAWTIKRPEVRILSVSILASFNLFTGYGACSAPVTAGLAFLLWLRPKEENAKMERRSAAVTLILFASGAIVFAHGYHWSPGTPGWRFPVPNWWDYPRFCALMFTSLLGLRWISFASTGLGAIVLAFVLAAFVIASKRIWNRKATDRAIAVWLLTGTSLVYAALTAVGRLPVTVEAAFAWRYMTLMTCSVCGLALALEDWANSRERGVERSIMICWLVIAVTIWCNFAPERSGATIAKAKRAWIVSYLRTRNLEKANNESNFWVYYPAPASPLIAEKLRWLEQRHLSFFRDLELNAESNGASSLRTEPE